MIKAKTLEGVQVNGVEGARMTDRSRARARRGFLVKWRERNGERMTEMAEINGKVPVRLGLGGEERSTRSPLNDLIALSFFSFPVFFTFEV